MITSYYTTPFSTLRVSSSVDSDNFEILTDVTNISSNGFFEPLSGNEIVLNDKYEARTTHRLFTPILDIVESDTIVIDSISYNIDLVQNFMGRHLELTLIKRK